MQYKISSKAVYSGRIFHVHKEIIENDVKEHFTYDIIHHHGGVAVLAIQDDKLLLVKQYRPAADQYLLEIPAGKLELNEEPYFAALRELEEETGFTSNHLDTICEMYSTPGFCDEILYIYQADGLKVVEHPAPMDDSEEIELVWIPILVAYKMIQKKEIIDAKTIVAIQHAVLTK